MVHQFKKLTKEEVELLLKAPVLLSVYASSTNHEINKTEKADAIKLAHIKTYSATPVLLEYYREAEKNFIQSFNELENKYAPFDDEKREALAKEIDKVNHIISKLDKVFADLLHSSLTNYAEHVKKSSRGFFENFVFPVPISGLDN